MPNMQAEWTCQGARYRGQCPDNAEMSPVAYYFVRGSLASEAGCQRLAPQHLSSISRCQRHHDNASRQAGTSGASSVHLT